MEGRNYPAANFLLILLAVIALVPGCGGGGGGSDNRSGSGLFQPSDLEIQVSAQSSSVTVDRSGNVSFSVTAELRNKPAGSDGLSLYIDCIDGTRCDVSPRHFSTGGTATVTVYATQNTPLGSRDLTVRATETHPSPAGPLFGFVQVTRTLDVGVQVRDKFSAVDFLVAAAPGLAAQPHNLATGDLTNDGIDDLVFTNYTNLQMIHLHDGNLQRTDLRFRTGLAQDLVVADFDGDGASDVALCYQSLRVYRGIGTEIRGVIEVPLLEEQQNLGSSAPIAQLGYFDLTNDGEKDLVALGKDSASVSSYAGTASAAFSPEVQTALDEIANRFSFPDIDGDGDIDVIFANRSGGHTLAFNDSFGALQIGELIAPGTVSADVASTDLNGDLIPDLIGANLDENRLSVHLGNGSSGFFPARYLTSESDPERVMLADFNDDSIPDIVALNSSTSRVTIFLGRGDGSFQAPVHFFAGLDCAPGENCNANPHTLAVGDYDGDGWIDIATAVPSTACGERCPNEAATLRLLRNRTGD